MFGFLYRTLWSGLWVVLPVALTIYLVCWLIATTEAIFRPPLEYLVQDAYWPGMGLLVGLLAVFLVGLLVKVWLTRQMIRLGEKLLERLPLVKDIYTSIRDLFGFFATGKEGDPQRVVMVTLPHTKVRLLGLMTREDFQGLPDGVGSNEEVAVYLPMSYQIGGFTLLVPRETVEPVDLSVEQGLRFALTAGVTTDRQKANGKQSEERHPTSSVQR